MPRQLSYTITIDRESCMGSGVCCVQAPNTFDIDDEMKSTVRDSRGEPLERIQAAAEGCPTRSISVVVERGDGDDA